MDEKLNDILGVIFHIKDDMDALIYLLKTLELVYEYEHDQEKRYLIKSIYFMLDKIDEKVDSAAKSLSDLTG